MKRTNFKIAVYINWVIKNKVADVSSRKGIFNVLRDKNKHLKPTFEGLTGPLMVREHIAGHRRARGGAVKRRAAARLPVGPRRSRFFAESR